MKEKGFTQSDPNRANEYGCIPFERMRSLMEQSIVSDFHGLPYPVQFRNQGALTGWRHEFAEDDANHPLWQRWAQPDFTWKGCLYTFNVLFRSMRPQDPYEARKWDAKADGLAIQISANLFYSRRGGALIEVTPALETLLMHSDFDKALPMSMVAPPYAAQYLHFSEHAGRVLSPFTEEPDMTIDGVFCFVGLRPSIDASQASMRYLEFVFILKTQGRCCGHYTLEQQIVSPQTGLSEWVEQMLERCSDPAATVTMRQRTVDLVGFVAKVFLYLGLKDARQVMIRDYSEAQQRMAGVGPKKLAKLGRRINALYDRIVVGPASLPQTPHFGAAGHEVMPHWRRGHFRMQAHGVGYSQHKLIFVAPVLVHADRLAEEQKDLPQRKAYRAGL